MPPTSSGPRKVIASMFELVLTFAGQLAAFSRGHRPHASEPVPARAFPEMTRTGELFRKHTDFLTRSEVQFHFCCTSTCVTLTHTVVGQVAAEASSGRAITC